MRPAGDIRHALLKAAHDFKAQGLKPSMRDLALSAKVGIREATTTVDNMRRAGSLVKAGQRKVDYRNKPVAVYDLPEPGTGFVDLAQVFSTWAS